MSKCAVATGILSCPQPLTGSGSSVDNLPTGLTRSDAGQALAAARPNLTINKKTAG